MNTFTKRLAGLKERAAHVEMKRNGAGPVGVLFFDGDAWWLNNVEHETEDAAREAFGGELLILADV